MSSVARKNNAHLTSVDGTTTVAVTVTGAMPVTPMTRGPGAAAAPCAHAAGHRMNANASAARRGRAGPAARTAPSFGRCTAETEMMKMAATTSIQATSSSAMMITGESASTSAGTVLGLHRTATTDHDMDDGTTRMARD